MNEQQIAYRIKQLLNRGLDLDAGKLARLKESRERALACQHVESRVPVLAWAGNAIGRSGGPSTLIPRLLLPMAVLILGLIAINQWRDNQVAAEIEEIDAAVLTGDLPLDAYLDKGFDAWLKRSSQ
jgi:hypothetical protein